MEEGRIIFFCLFHKWARRKRESLLKCCKRKREWKGTILNGRGLRDLGLSEFWWELPGDCNFPSFTFFNFNSETEFAESCWYLKYEAHVLLLRIDCTSLFLTCFANFFYLLGISHNSKTVITGYNLRKKNNFLLFWLHCLKS